MGFLEMFLFYQIGIRISGCKTELLMGKWILLGVRPMKILFLVMDQSAKEFDWCWTKCAMGLAGDPVGLYPTLIRKIEKERLICK